MKTSVHRQTTTLPQVLSTKQKNKIKLRLAIISIENHIPNRDNHRDDKLKIDIYRQTTTLLQVLNTQQKDITKLN